MTDEEKIITQNAELPTEEKKDEDEASSGGESSSDGKRDEDSSDGNASDGKTLKNSAPKPAKPLIKNKPPVVGKIQGRSFKVAPPRMNNSPRGR